METIDPKLLRPAPWHQQNRQKWYVELIESIESVGLLVPIAVNEDNEIEDGYYRWMACCYLGMKKVAIIRVEKGHGHFQSRKDVSVLSKIQNHRGHGGDD